MMTRELILVVRLHVSTMVLIEIRQTIVNVNGWFDFFWNLEADRAIRSRICNVRRFRERPPSMVVADISWRIRVELILTRLKVGCVFVRPDVGKLTCWLVVTLRIVDRQLLNLAARVEEKTADGSENDTDDDEEGYDGFWGENRSGQ